MHTARTVRIAVAAIALGVEAALVVWLGLGTGLVVGIGLVTVAVTRYALTLGPRHRHGAAAPAAFGALAVRVGRDEQTSVARSGGTS